MNKIWTNADYAITAQNNFDPIPIAAADAAAKAPGVEAIGNVRTGDARAFGNNFFATAVNPAGGSMFKLEWKQGSQAVFSQLGADGFFTDDGYAKRHHLTLGSTIDMTFSTGVHKTFVLKRDLQPADGWLAVRHGHDLAVGVGQAEPEPEQPLLVRAHEGRRRRRRTLPRSTAP